MTFANLDNFQLVLSKFIKLKVLQQYMQEIEYL